MVGSYLQSGGDTTITARGREGESGSGDLTIIGSEVHAGGKVVLDAANDLTLLSAEEISDFASSNKNSSTGFGVGISVGSGGIGGSINANASKSKGSGQGSDTRHIETIIQGDKGVDFASGNDTTLKGAQIIGEQITGNVGDDLTIINEQDTYNESRNQSSSGGSTSIGGSLDGLSSFGGSYSSQTQKSKSSYEKR